MDPCRAGEARLEPADVDLTLGVAKRVKVAVHKLRRVRHRRIGAVDEGEDFVHLRPLTVIAQKSAAANSSKGGRNPFPALGVHIAPAFVRVCGALCRLTLPSASSRPRESLVHTIATVFG